MYQALCLAAYMYYLVQSSQPLSIFTPNLEMKAQRLVHCDCFAPFFMLLSALFHAGNTSASYPVIDPDPTHHHHLLKILEGFRQEGPYQIRSAF